MIQTISSETHHLFCPLSDHSRLQSSCSHPPSLPSDPIAMPKHALEYDEEEEGGDLFGSEDERAGQSQTSPGFAEYNTAIPIVTPVASSTPDQPQAGPSRAHTSSKGADMAVKHIWPDAQTRLSDLRAMKRQNIPLGQGTGSRSLREACMKGEHPIPLCNVLD